MYQEEKKGKQMIVRGNECYILETWIFMGFHRTTYETWNSTDRQLTSKSHRSFKKMGDREPGKIFQLLNPFEHEISWHRGVHYHEGWFGQFPMAI